jgi:hypothetical protein
MTRAAAAVALVALLALAPSASGLFDLIQGGTTRLKIDRGIYAKLKEEGVRVVRLRPAKLAGRVVTMPVTAGQIDPARASGTITQDGGFRLAGGGRKVSVDHFGVSTPKKWLSARIGGKQVRFASLKGFGFGRRGFGDEWEADRLLLTRVAADRLNRGLGLDGLFRAGHSFGSIAGTTEPVATRAASGEIRVAIAEGFNEKLESLGVKFVGFETNPVSETPLTWSFALLGGAVALDMSSGSVGAESGWRIYANPDGPGTVMTLTNMAVGFDTKLLGANAHLHDAFGAFTPIGGVPLATLDTTAAARLVDPGSRTMTLSGAPAALTQSFADRLNEVFAQPKGKSPLFFAGEPLGTVSVSLTTH